MNKQKTKPIVSVVIPTYNRARWIRRAIQSVLEQTFTGFELIVVDDCSSDNTEEVIKSFHDERLRYIRLSENTGGCTVPRNTGFELARGEYLASLDDDYIWDKDKLSKQVEFLDSHPDYVLVGTNALFIDEGGHEVGRTFFPEDDGKIRDKFLQQNCIVQGSVMFRRAAALGFGGYEWGKGKYYSEDYDRWLRLGTVGKLANLPIYAVSFTTLPGGLTKSRHFNWYLGAIQTIQKYRGKYPNYWRAVAVRYFYLADVLLHVISDLPPFSKLKGFLKARCPAGWRVIVLSHSIVLRVLTGSILAIANLSNRFRGWRLHGAPSK